MFHLDNVFQNDELNEDSDGSISLSTRTNGQEDSYGYITNMESEIDIRIDQDFMRLLEDAGVDSNPEVRFFVLCSNLTRGNFLRCIIIFSGWQCALHYHVRNRPR